jgi:hypothetical protein
MIRWVLLGPYRLAEPWLRHPNFFVRRGAQVAAFGVGLIWLALPSDRGTKDGIRTRSDQLADELVGSPRMLEFLHGTAIVKPLIGPVCRLLALRLSVYAKTRYSGPEHDRDLLLRLPGPTGFLLRLSGPVGQVALRNLLLWQNHVLPLLGPAGADFPVNIVLALEANSVTDAQLFDLYSVALMLERVRSVSVFWDEHAAIEVASGLMSQRELQRWQVSERLGDLADLPRDITRRIATHGTRGGVALLQQGRRHVNHFLKLAFPGQPVIAVGLREEEDGGVPSEELEAWLALIDKFRALSPRTAFVVLNCLAPSQWRQWPEHLRFARHQGLTLQDTLCLAQVADGYVGVLDLFGLAAHSAGRPGVYIPLEDGEADRSENLDEKSRTSLIMVGTRHDADIEAALKRLATLPPFTSQMTPHLAPSLCQPALLQP